MVIRSQTEAKRFFVEKIVAQARAEQVRISEAEYQMLSWSESDPEYVVDPGLPDRLASEISDEEYESKIAGLLERGLAAEVRTNSEAQDQWNQAADVLDQGDHYIGIMVDRAMASQQTRTQVKRWWEFWR
jgi:hypothetical protein